MNATLIDVHLGYLEADGLSPKTVQDRRVLLTRLDRELPDGLSHATTDDLVVWLRHGGWSVKTRATYWGHLAGFYRWRAEHDWVPDPMARLRCPKTRRGLPRPVTDEQLRRALARAVRPWFTAVVLAAWAGMRVGEIAAAERCDFTAERVLIVGKGGRWRSVPTHPDLWVEVSGLPDGPLVRWRGEPVTGAWLSRRASAYLTRIGLPDVTMHRFRHWFGTEVQAGYHDLRVTQELMGHASPVDTAGYAQITDGQRRLAIRTLPTLRGALIVAA
jgi:integrase/recombinase XerD